MLKEKSVFALDCLKNFKWVALVYQVNKQLIYKGYDYSSWCCVHRRLGLWGWARDSLSHKATGGRSLMVPLKTLWRISKHHGSYMIRYYTRGCTNVIFVPD